MDVIKEIKEAWGWVGIDPSEIVGENDFGNLMIKDFIGKYWRLCPEDLYCEVVANNREELDHLSSDQEFLSDWYMQTLVEQAQGHLGSLTNDRKYCFVIPGVLGGEYSISNIKTAPITEMIRLSGNLAKQVKELPDGEKVQLHVID